MCYSCKASDDHAKGHSVSTENQGSALVIDEEEIIVRYFEGRFRTSAEVMVQF